MNLRVFSSKIDMDFKAIFSYKEIVQIAEKGVYYSKLLSSCVGKDVLFNESDLLHLLKSMKDLNALDFTAIVFVDHYENIFEKTQTVLVDCGNRVLSFNSSESMSIAIVEETTAVTAFEHYFNKIWNQLPRILKDRDRVNEKIDALLERMPGD
jgi:hypothetical protein